MVCHDLDRIHFEVKRNEALRLYPSLDQAINDSGKAIPVVAHRKNKEAWVAILRMEDFIELVGELVDLREIKRLLDYKEGF